MQRNLDLHLIQKSFQVESKWKRPISSMESTFNAQKLEEFKFTSESILSGYVNSVMYEEMRVNIKILEK